MSSHTVRLAKTLRELDYLRKLLKSEADRLRTDYSVGVYNGIDYAISILQGKDSNPISLNAKPIFIIDPKDDSEELKNE